MRISDWSSDVCSSDLSHRQRPSSAAARRTGGDADELPFPRSEERRVGKECVRRVDLGGRRIIKKKIKAQPITTRSNQIQITAPNITPPNQTTLYNMTQERSITSHHNSTI